MHYRITRFSTPPQGKLISLINTEVIPFKASAYPNGKFVTVTNEQLKGRWSVFVFFPAAFTFVCPTELGDLADNYALIGDPGHKLAKAFDVLIEEGDDAGLTLRGTFIVNPDGKIMTMKKHPDGVGRDAKELMRRVKAAQYITAHPGEVCPAKWNEGAETLKPSFDLVGKI